MGQSDIRFYLSLLWRRTPYLLAAVVIGGAIGVVAALMIEPTYRATTKIVVEGAEIPLEMAKTTVSETVADQLQLIQQEVTTRKNLLALAEHFGIYGSEMSRMSPDDIVTDMRSRIAFEQVSLSVNAGTSIFSVSFDATDRVLAANVANEIASIIISKNVNARADRAGATMSFFKAESARLSGALGQIEGQILTLKKAHQDSLPEGLEFRRSQQTALQARVLGLESEETALRARRFAVSKMDEAGAQATGLVSPEGQALADLNRSLTEQLAVYSERSPTIVALRGQIAALRKRLAARSGDDASAGQPAMTGREIELTEIDSRLKSIADEKSSTRGQMSALATAIAATPATEKALNALVRSRDNVQIQYNAAIAKLGEAATGNRIEMRSQGGSFSVLEPATPPQKPAGPKRRLIAAGGAFAGLAVGAGLVLLLELLNKTLRRPSDVAVALQSPPLATIPLILTPGQERFQARRMSVRVAAMVSVFIVAAMYASVAG